MCKLQEEKMKKGLEENKARRRKERAKADCVLSG
jgi:predicted DNA-binding WGR domain protein